MNDLAQSEVPAFPTAPLSRDERMERMLLHQDIEQFYFWEAELLDERRFEEWLELLTEDIRYFMPLRRNVKYGQHAARENTREGEDAAWFDEGKRTLTQRVAQLATGIHWAEEPLSRISHLVTNVRVDSPLASSDRDALAVSSRFLVYRNRVDYETDIFVGKRHDRLRQEQGQWRVCERTIILDQSVLLAKNLTLFF
jgi:3-phenylpropionate/cinnamic acid dioxygenase small subunit